MIRSGAATDLTKACNQGGISSNPELGKVQGMIGLLSNMRLSRKVYTEQSVLACMIGVDNAALYGP